MKKFLTSRYIAAALFAIGILWNLFETIINDLGNVLFFGSAFNFATILPGYGFWDFICRFLLILSFLGIAVLLFVKLDKKAMAIPAVLALLTVFIRVITVIVDLFSDFYIHNIIVLLLDLLGYGLFALGIIAFIAYLFLCKKEKFKKFYIAPGALLIISCIASFIASIYFPIYLVCQGWWSIGYFIFKFIFYSIVLVIQIAIGVAFVLTSRYVANEDNNLSSLMFWKKK